MALKQLRYACRLLLKNRGFSATAILTVALGIGANTAIFQLLDAISLRSLPVTRPEQLVVVQIPNVSDERGTFDTTRPALTTALWDEIHDRQNVFSSIFAWSDITLNLAAGGEGRYVNGLEVSGDFFNGLGIEPAFGRLINSDNDRRGCGNPSAVISYAFWQREFGGSSNILDKSLVLNDHAFQIVGVTRPSFFGLQVGASFDVAVPICAEAILGGESSRMGENRHWWLTVMGRMRPGWSMERTRLALASMSPGVFDATLPPAWPAADVPRYLNFILSAATAGNGFSDLRDSYESPLWLLQGLAGLILLLACANLGNLMLARTSARNREISVQFALGASRTHLVTQLMTESLLLSVSGGVLGLCIARGLSESLVAFLTQDGSTQFLNLDDDWRVLALMAALTVLTSLLFGLSPALTGSRADLAGVLKGGTGLTADRRGFRIRRSLMVAQVAISLMLVGGALMFSGTLRRLETLNPGFQKRGIVIANVSLRRLSLPSSQLVRFKGDLVERLRATPGVGAAADTDIVPLSGADSTRAWMEGSTVDDGINLEYGHVGPDYFTALRVPLLAGRTFDAHDTLTSPRVAIVNLAFARQLTHGANPVGRRLWVGVTPNDRQTLYEIVGLVENTRLDDLHEDPAPIAFLASSQDRHPDARDQILVRSNAPVGTVLALVKAALAEVNPDIIVQFQTLESEVRNSLMRERLVATLSALFGLLALVLSCVGLYGIVSYNVEGRIKEIGIRMALGATARSVWWLILRESLLSVSIGVALGIPALVFGTRIVFSLLSMLKPANPIYVAIATLVLFAIGGAAAFFPARRASRVHPIIALRNG